jgi:hypothetical protein
MVRVYADSARLQDWNGFFIFRVNQFVLTGCLVRVYKIRIVVNDFDILTFARIVVFK